MLVKKITPTNNRTGNLALTKEEKEKIENGDVSSIKLVLGHGRNMRPVAQFPIEPWMLATIKLMYTDDCIPFYIMRFKK